MTNLPIAIFFIPFGLFVLVYIFFVLMNVLHLHKYGLESKGTYMIIIIYLVGTVLIFAISTAILVRYDWTATIDFGQLFKTVETKNIYSPL